MAPAKKKKKATAKKPAKMKFVVLKGRHIDENNIVYEQNDVVACANDLRKVFPNKFALHNPDAPVVKNAGTADAVIVNTPTEAPKPPEPVDVTDSFEGAEDAGLTVHRLEDGWTVTESDDGSAAHEEPLTSEEAVNALLNELVAVE